MENMSIQWFPGHMAKTRRLIRDNLKRVDAVVEVTDARIPRSSRNPEIKKLVGDKPRIVLLNKADSADDEITKEWIDYYKKSGVLAIPTDCRSGKGVNAFGSVIRKCLSEELERRANRGMEGKAIRIMIVGIPNVGKSSFINRLSNGRRTKVEDRPGVTRDIQWVNTNDGIEVMDMPGVLWPKFDNKTVGEHLAFTGAVKDQILDIEYLAMRLIEVLCENYFELMAERYKITHEEIEGLDSYDILELIGKKRSMLMSGGRVNTERAAIMLLDEYRAGKIGNITLEKPYKNKEEDNA
jgi:ribosome biogenesis GTPase A